MMVPTKRVLLLAALFMTIVSTIMWGLDWIPAWGILLAVPAGVATLVIIGFLLLVAAWLGNGAH